MSLALGTSNFVDHNARQISAFYRYRALPSMREVHKSNALVDFVVGGFRGGKTYGLAKDVIERVTEKDGCVGVVLRFAFADITRPGGVLDTYKEAIRDIGGIVVEDYHGTGHYITLRTQDGGTGKILFMSGADPKDLGSNKYNVIHIVEASQCAEALLDMALSRLSIKGVRHKVFVDTNPVDQHHWIYKRAVTLANEDTALFRVPTSDNEAAGHIDAGYCARLIRAKGNDWAKVWLNGEWGFTGEGDPVFPMFSEDRHLSDFKPMVDMPFVVGLDFGFRRPAAVIGQIQAGTLVIFDAILGKDQTIDQFYDEVSYRLRGLGAEKVEWWGDDAGNQVRDTDGDSAIGRLRARGVHVRGEKHRINAGLDAMRDLMSATTATGRFRLMLDRKCARDLIVCLLYGYHYPEKQASYSHTDPLPEKDGVYDHLADALRYLAVGLFGLDARRDINGGVVAQVIQRQAAIRGSKGSWA